MESQVLCSLYRLVVWIHLFYLLLLLFCFETSCHSVSLPGLELAMCGRLVADSVPILSRFMVNYLTYAKEQRAMGRSQVSSGELYFWFCVASDLLC